jgi:hypothetical protein
MENLNFIELKERILSQAIANDVCLEELERAKVCESWEQLQEVIADNIWWCTDRNIELPDGYYKSSIREFTIVNGKVEGECKIWWDNGELREHYFYKDGKLEGEYKSWYDNGQLTTYCTFKNGKEHGECKSWHENGKLWVHCFYNESKLVETIVG